MSLVCLTRAFKTILIGVLVLFLWIAPVLSCGRRTSNASSGLLLSLTIKGNRFCKNDSATFIDYLDAVFTYENSTGTALDLMLGTEIATTLLGKTVDDLSKHAYQYRIAGDAFFLQNGHAANEDLIHERHVSLKPGQALPWHRRYPLLVRTSPAEVAASVLPGRYALQIILMIRTPDMVRNRTQLKSRWVSATSDPVAIDIPSAPMLQTCEYPDGPTQ